MLCVARTFLPKNGRWNDQLLRKVTKYLIKVIKFVGPFELGTYMENIEIEEYDYDLPVERIAQYPVEKRDESLLLLYNKGMISKDRFKNITSHLPTNSLLVFNNTKVIRARILFRKESGAIIEIFCLEPLSPATYDQNLSSTVSVEWKCIIGNLKKWKSGHLSLLAQPQNNEAVRLTAEKISPEGEAWRIKFSWEPSWLSFGEILDTIGRTPLPPYIKREDNHEDYLRYQTIYSEIDGSVAAPTAGLHFTREVLNSILDMGISTESITLHVGAGTFKPVKSGNIEGHEMHTEHYYVNKSTIQALAKDDSKIVAVGTTSVRCLESIYWVGKKIMNDPVISQEKLYTGQWEPYEDKKDIPRNEILGSVIDYMERNHLSHLSATTKIMIVPGYRFRIIEGLITNFHQPKSTLLLLLAAWVGTDWKKIYEYALKNGFRFLSYGDSSLLL